MDIKFKEDFIVLWKKFFGETELPIAFYYTDEEGHAELVKPGTIALRCVIAALSLVRKGRSLCFDAESIGCLGGQKSLGFRETEEPDIVIFFACPDVLSGLFTLANFEETEPNVVFTPWGSGCSSIVAYPFLRKTLSVQELS